MKIRTALLHALSAALFVACGGSNSTETEEQELSVEPISEGTAAVQWTGYYSGSLPCADGSTMATQLWVRSDSSFVLREQCSATDSLVDGRIGRWSTAEGFLQLHAGKQVFSTLSPHEKGLTWLGEKGGASASAEGQVLERVGDGSLGQVPRMRLQGTFIYLADAMSFAPCGSDLVWPCAGGQEWTDEGKTGGSLNNMELERHYLRSVKTGGEPWTIRAEVSLAMGPAMEGDEEDEYIFVHRVVKQEQNCP